MMEAERAGVVARAPGNIAPPAKQISPVKVKKTVSARSIFKYQARKTKQIDITTQINPQSPETGVKDVSVAKSLNVNSHSSSHSQQKRGNKRRRSDMHPLAVEFKDTSDDYRRHLYKTTSLTINKKLEALLHKLHESTLQTMPSSNGQQDVQSSPLKITAPAKYEGMAEKLYRPLSQYRLILQRTNTDGERVPLPSTLEKRMEDYQERIDMQAEDIAQLQKKWEAVVGEIWHLGVITLGEGTMERMLFTKEGPPTPSAAPQAATEVESTLFVPEQGSSTPAPTRTSKKRVTFEASEEHVEPTATSTSGFPNFLYRPSRYQNKALLAIPHVSDQDIRALEKDIKELGQVQIEEYRKIEKDHHEFWRKKTKQLTNALREE